MPRCAINMSDVPATGSCPPSPAIAASFHEFHPLFPLFYSDHHEHGTYAQLEPITLLLPSPSLSGSQPSSTNDNKLGAGPGHCFLFCFARC